MSMKWVQTSTLRTHSSMSQGLHEKTTSMSDSVLGLNNHPVTGQPREDFSGMQQKPKQSSQVGVPLDPLEEKILYHMDDNAWGSSFSRNDLENGSGGFSWSALMQSALEDDVRTLDGNSKNQLPNIHSFNSSLDNVCGKSFGMLQHIQSHEDGSFLQNSSCFVLGQIGSEINQNSLASQSAVHLMPSSLGLSRREHWVDTPDISGEALMPVQDQAHLQITCNSSLASQLRELFGRSNLAVNASVGQHQLVAVINEVPTMFPVAQQKTSEVYSAPADAFSEGIFTHVSRFPESTYNIHQNSILLQQARHNNLIMEYLKTDIVPDAQGIASVEGDKLHDQGSSNKMPTANEPGIISNLKLVASAETGTSCLMAKKQEDHSSSRTPSGVPFGETQSNIGDVVTGHLSQLSVGTSLDNLQMQNYTEKLGHTTWHSNSGLSQSAMQYQQTVNQTMAALRPKKRRFTTYGQWPWHKEVMRGSDTHQSISVSEQEWALATNRIPEKMQDNVGDVEPMPPSKKRILSTTQLMQQLLRPAPAFTFSWRSTVHHESVLYFVSRLALGDACSHTYYRRNNLLSNPENSRTTSEKIETFKTEGHLQYSEVVKAFIKKIQKLESEFHRMEKTTSVIDIRVEIQDLERFSVINRFAKFHSRAQANSSGNSSSSSSAMPKSVPQKYIIAQLVPRALPEGVHCLSL